MVKENLNYIEPHSEFERDRRRKISINALIRHEHESLSLRDQMYPSLSRGENRWRIVLALAYDETERRSSSLKTLALDTAIPPTTILRCIDALEKGGLVERMGDPKDKRVVHICLTQTCRSALVEWFSQKRSRIQGLARDT